MKTVTFQKNESGDWQSKDGQYRIMSRWLKGYTLYFDDEYLASGTRANNLKAQANQHAQTHTDLTDIYSGLKLSP